MVYQESDETDITDGTEIDPLRCEQMGSLRKLVLPSLVFLLHNVLHESEQFKECMKLADLITGEQHKLYQVGQHMLTHDFNEGLVQQIYYQLLKGEGDIVTVGVCLSVCMCISHILSRAYLQENRTQVNEALHTDKWGHEEVHCTRTVSLVIDHYGTISPFIISVYVMFETYLACYERYFNEYLYTNTGSHEEVHCTIIITLSSFSMELSPLLKNIFWQGIQQSLATFCQVTVQLLQIVDMNFHLYQTASFTGLDL